MRRVALLVSFLAALVVTGQPARADDIFLFRHPKVDPRVSDVSLGAGIVSTLAFWTVLDWRWHGHSQATRWGVWGATTAGCMVLSPIIAAAVVRERELTSREVAVMEGSCLLPIVGGLLVNAIYDANPQWEAPPASPARVARKIKARHRAR